MNSALDVSYDEAGSSNSVVAAAAAPMDRDASSEASRSEFEK
jgi:hypothetical protein